jgi:hypothetical protein
LFCGEQADALLRARGAEYRLNRKAESRIPVKNRGRRYSPFSAYSLSPARCATSARFPARRRSGLQRAAWEYPSREFLLSLSTPGPGRRKQQHMPLPRYAARARAFLP